MSSQRRKPASQYRGEDREFVLDRLIWRRLLIIEVEVSGGLSAQARNPQDQLSLETPMVGVSKVQMALKTEVSKIAKGLSARGHTRRGEVGDAEETKKECCEEGRKPRQVRSPGTRRRCLREEAVTPCAQGCCWVSQGTPRLSRDCCIWPSGSHRQGQCRSKAWWKWARERAEGLLRASNG